MRIFIATTFPVEVLRSVNARVDPLKPRLPSASWVRQEAQHLTLAFLGEQPEPQVSTLAEPLAAVLAGIPRFESRLHGCGFFPNARHARVGWIGLDAEQAFARVAHDVREVALSHGVKLDNVEFRPHLTLMRIRDPWPPASIELFSKSFRDFTSASFPVEHVTMFSSRLDPKGAIHTPIRTFDLARD